MFQCYLLAVVGYRVAMFDTTSVFQCYSLAVVGYREAMFDTISLCFSVIH